MAKRKDRNFDDEKENSLNSGSGNRNFDPYNNNENKVTTPGGESIDPNKKRASGDRNQNNRGDKPQEKTGKSIEEKDLKMPSTSDDGNGASGNGKRKSQKQVEDELTDKMHKAEKSFSDDKDDGFPRFEKYTPGKTSNDNESTKNIQDSKSRTANKDKDSTSGKLNPETPGMTGKPSKNTRGSKGRLEDKSPGSRPENERTFSKGDNTSELSQEKINLPEHTSTSESAETSGRSPVESREEQGGGKFPRQNTSSAKTGRAKNTTSTDKKSRDKIAPGPEVKGSGKKTQETKTENPETSITDDLKNMAMAAASKFADKFLPDEKMRDEITRTAMEFLPDQEDIDKSIKKAKSKFSPEIDQVNKMVDKFISPEDLKETKYKIQTAAKQLKNKSQESSEEKTFKEMSLISEYDVHLFKEGRHFHLYNKFGSHLMDYNGTSGVYFAVWAPNAKNVSVIGDFNNWVKMANPMKSRPDESGIWEVFIPEAKQGSLYKYFIQSTTGYEAEKGDPFAFMWEVPPNTASVVWDLKSEWEDDEWLTQRKIKAGKAKPVSVYELHVGSWRRVPEDGNRSLTYKELAQQLPEYLNKMGFTHVEFMPVMEHPFFGSWGYQVTGYFAPSSRFGNPQDFMSLIDSLHKAGIGVILDWVPSHFPSDLHGLHYFDGTYLYEHEDPEKGFHPDWQSYIFNYGRNEVRSFLISNALFWLDKFHADGLRVDAVASMLYLDYSRKHGEWQPNEHGGNENLEAISFLKQFNEVVYAEFPDTITIAEESTAWPMVSKPTYMGGLGFGMKWMMGWMHDTLEYFKKDPVHRKHHQDTITFSTNYAFTENFMLPLSHDEVVYGKKSLLNKMPGDQWNKFSNLRALYSYMYAHPGTKLLFMGAEFAQIEEWGHDTSLDWHLTEEGPHREMQETISTLNSLYKKEPALYENAFDPEGFEWVDFNDRDSSIISFLRKGINEKDTILVVGNLTPIPRENYRIGVPAEGNWKEIFNSDDRNFGGSNVKNAEAVTSSAMPLHGHKNSVALTLPPMGVIYLKRM